MCITDSIHVLDDLDVNSKRDFLLKETLSRRWAKDTLYGTCMYVNVLIFACRVHVTYMYI